MAPYSKAFFLLEVFIIIYFIPQTLTSEFQTGELFKNVHSSSIVEQFFKTNSVTAVKNSSQSKSSQIDDSNSKSTSMEFENEENSNGIRPSLVGGTRPALVNDSTPKSGNHPYSVTSPYGKEGQPLLLDTTTNVRGYQAFPKGNTMMLSQPHPFDAPASRGPIWDKIGQASSPWGAQWVTYHDWNSRRMDVNDQGTDQMASGSRLNSEIDQHSVENRELVSEILTKALDILTLESPKTMSACGNRGETKCKHSDDSEQESVQKEKIINSDPCRDAHGGNTLCSSIKNRSTYSDLFIDWLRKSTMSEPGRPNDEASDPNVSRRQRLDDDHHHLPQPRTRAGFRSVQTSTSNLARLLNPGDMAGGSGGGGGSNSGSRGNTGGSHVSTGGSDIGGGGGGGGDVSPTSVHGGDSGDVPGVSGVDPSIFNKFAVETMSFEKQAASEIQRLDNLLRQLAMAAQTDFTSVSNSVNALQEELVQTQQQLVQAWSILNATHVKDNTQTIGDLRDVKTDVYRLHALLTGATPLGQATAHGRAAEVKEVATLGPGVDCAAIAKTGVNTSGVYDLQPDPSNNLTRMTAFCDMDTDGGGWTVFQRRKDGSDDFFRGWNSYKHGFGSYRHDHWLGLENIHLLTKFGDNVMRIELTDWENKTQWAEFSYTRIMDESDGYRILVGGYRGTAGDPFHSLSYSMRMQSMRFSTFDSDNDLDSGGNCALTFTSGWWFNKCFQVNLNGVWYGNSRYAGPSMNGIVWDLWPEHFNGYSLKHTEMKLRPADFHRRK